MENIREYSIFESMDLTSYEGRLFDRMEKNKGTWALHFKDVLEKRHSNPGKFDKFVEHYKILYFINKFPDTMTKVLLPLIKVDSFTTWVAEVNKDLPEEFQNGIGVSVDMKKLGF